MQPRLPLIEIENLHHRFANGAHVLRGISLTIDRDSFTVLGGENGSGKTVLMKHLNGLLEPTSGTVKVDGVSVSEDSLRARLKVGFVFQDSDTQIVAQTVEDDIAFGPINIGCEREETALRVKNAAEALNITRILEQSPHRLSGGEKKKTAIAGILAMNPEIVVFDEPFAGLDYGGVKMLLKKMLEIRSCGTSVLVITHDLEKVLAHADRFIIISNGIIAGDGTPPEMLQAASEHGMRVPPGMSVPEMTWMEPES